MSMDKSCCVTDGNCKMDDAERGYMQQETKRENETMAQKVS